MFMHAPPIGRPGSPPRPPSRPTGVPRRLCVGSPLEARHRRGRAGRRREAGRVHGATAHEASHPPEALRRLAATTCVGAGTRSVTVWRHRGAKRNGRRPNRAGEAWAHPRSVAGQSGPGRRNESVKRPPWRKRTGGALRRRERACRLDVGRRVRPSSPPTSSQSWASRSHVTPVAATDTLAARSSASKAPSRSAPRLRHGAERVRNQLDHFAHHRARGVSVPFRLLRYLSRSPVGRRSRQSPTGRAGTRKEAKVDETGVERPKGFEPSTFSLGS